MLPDEREQLLALFADQQRWCQDVEAKDEAGEAVRYDDPSAVAWDITGGMCVLFGWERAMELFPQLDRHVHQVRRRYQWGVDPGIASMVELQNTNDKTYTTFEMIDEWLRSMPVWSGHRRCSDFDGRVETKGTCKARAFL